MKTAIFDIETTAINNWSTLEGLTAIHCLVIQDENKKVHRFQAHNISDGLKLLSTKDCVVGHNGIGFDIPVLKKRYGFDHPLVLDTMVLSRLMYPDLKDNDWKRGPQVNDSAKDLPKKLFGSHSLGAWGYRLGVNKDAFGSDTD